MSRPGSAEYHMMIVRAVIPDENRGRGRRYRLTGDNRARPAGTTWYELGVKHMQLPREFSDVSTYRHIKKNFHSIESNKKGLNNLAPCKMRYTFANSQAIYQAIQSSAVLQQRQRDATDPQKQSRLLVTWKGWAELKARWKHAFETTSNKWVMKWKV